MHNAPYQGKLLNKNEPNMANNQVGVLPAGDSLEFLQLLEKASNLSDALGHRMRETHPVSRGISA
jgi:hypothetical protein